MGRYVGWYYGSKLTTKREVFGAVYDLREKHRAVSTRLDALVAAGKVMPGALLVHSYISNDYLMRFSKEYNSYHKHPAAQKTTMLDLCFILKLAVEEYEKALAFVEEQEAADDYHCHRADVCFRKGIEAGMNPGQAIAYGLYDINNYRAEKGNGVTPEEYLEWARQQDQELLSYAPGHSMKQQSADEADAYAKEQVRREANGLPVQSPAEWEGSQAAPTSDDVDTRAPISISGLKNKIHSVLRSAGIKRFKEGDLMAGNGYVMRTTHFGDGGDDWHYIEPVSASKDDMDPLQTRIEELLRDALLWEAFIVGWTTDAYGAPLLQFAVFPEATRQYMARLSPVASPPTHNNEQS